MTSAAAIPSQRSPLGPVRVSLPARVAFDLDALKKSITGLAEQIGHPACFSGADCLFDFERNFVVDAGAKVSSVPFAGGWQQDGSASLGRALPQDPIPLQPVSVTLAPAVRNDLKKVLAAVDRVVNLLGCPSCHSGFPLHFRDELNLIMVNEQLQAKRLSQLG
jgi:hypothetical protein